MKPKSFNQPLLLEQLREWEIDISVGQLNQIIVEGKEKYHREKTEYILSREALSYMERQKFPKNQWQKLTICQNRVFKDKEEWELYLKQVGITQNYQIKKATEGALLGAIISNGVSPNLGIISDGAGQFRLLEHGLCWVHAERLINKLIPLTEEHLKALEGVQDQIWQFDQELKNDKNLTAPEQEQEKARLESRFSQIFSQSTCFEPRLSSISSTEKRKSRITESFRQTGATTS